MNRALLLALSLWPAVPAAAQQIQVRTLREAFAQALQNSESIATSRQAVREAEALYRRALGDSFPGLSFVHRTDWEDGPAPGRRGGPPESHGGLRLSQLGLTGYRELAALRGAKANLGRRGFERERAEQLLLADVAAAFFGLLQAKENVAATQLLLASARKRHAELSERVRVGRTREADAIGQEFQTSELRSQLEESARQVEARSDLLAFLTRAAVADPQAADDRLLGTERPLEGFLARISERPDVRAARAARDASAAGVALSRAEYLPELGLQANYYAYRPAARRHERWDASATIGVPLWSWGARRASVDAANAGLEGFQLELQAVRRRAELDVRNAHRDYSSARRQLELATKGLALARRDYELQTRDEQRGLVTSLEVLESLNRLNGAELARTNALLHARLAALNLELAAGASPGSMEMIR